MLKWIVLSFLIGGLAFWHYYGRDEPVDVDHLKADAKAVGGVVAGAGQHLWTDVEKLAPGDKVADLKQKLCTAKDESEADCVERIKVALRTGGDAIQKGVQTVSQTIRTATGNGE